MSLVAISRDEAENFLYREAQLLDSGRFDEWLQLFAPDGSYWLPLDENTDPEQEPSILYDDFAGLSQRVFQLQGPHHPSQQPPSRTVHMLSNILVESPLEDGSQLVRYNLAVCELRPGNANLRGLGEPRWMAATCECKLRRAAGWKIVQKKVLLIDRDVPMASLTFIV